MEKIRIVKDITNRELLDFVRRPGRYIGGEINQIKKDINACKLRVALCFPDVYEVAMSNSGIQIIYGVLNNIDGVAAERCFAPWTDAAEIMHQKNIPLFTLESKAAVGDFDIVGFSLSTELCYTNVLEMLDLANIPLRSKDRNEDAPIVIAGGGMSNCAEPMADFIDVFILGEGEEAASELTRLVMDKKQAGQSKAEILKTIDQNFAFAYVPQFYTFEYDGDKIISFEPKRKFKNAVVEDFENAYAIEKPIVPFIDCIHERVTVEIMRGCPGRCRFCQASFLRRPIRTRSVDRIFEIAKNAYLSSGFDTVSLLSLSSADYPQLEELLKQCYSYFTDKKVGISLPSLRVDKQLQLLPKFVNEVRKGGLTIAIEAASQRLRKMINKPLTDEDLFAAVEQAYQAGWQKLKLYFMAGFPGETEEDIIRIVDLSNELAKLRRKVCKKTAQLNVAVSWLVPKPHTPFGWLGQKSREYFENARQLILDRKHELKARYLQFKFHTYEQSVLESAIGRGDRRIGKVIETAWRDGAKFDLWNEHFDYSIWKNAFDKCGLDVDTAAQKRLSPDEILPWAHLGGPKHDYLLGHYDDAMKLA